MLLPAHQRQLHAALAPTTPDDDATGASKRSRPRPSPSQRPNPWRRFTCRVWPVLPQWARRLAVRVAVPRVSLGAAAVIHDTAGRVLLAHHTYRRQPWDLPGGFVRRGEQPAASLQRELREELGVPTMVGPLLAATTAGAHLTLYYRVALNGVPRPDDVEIDGYRYVAVADIPALLGTTPGWLAWVGEPPAATRSAA